MSGVKRQAWLWLGVFIAFGNFALAVVSLVHGDLFLFLVGVSVGTFVIKPLWDVRHEFRRLL